TGDLVAHVGRGRVGIPREVELYVDETALRPTAGRHDIDALHTGQLIFQGLGDLRLDDFGRRALVHRHDRDHRLVDGRVLTHRQSVVRNQAYQDNDKGQHRREDGAFDTDV